MKKGINKFGIKLEDYVDYASYLKAYQLVAVKAHQKTPEGQLAKEKAMVKFMAPFRLTKWGKAVNASNSVASKLTKMNRVPKWADLKAIQQFYYNCPEGYEVDHIVPFNGENVSGLHVLNNLQYLTQSDNSRKGNTWICSS